MTSQTLSMALWSDSDVTKQSVCHQVYSCTVFHVPSLSVRHDSCMTAVVKLRRDFAKNLPHHLRMFLRHFWPQCSVFNCTVLYSHRSPSWLHSFECCSFNASGWRFEATCPLWSMGCCLRVLMLLKTYFVVLWLQKPGAAFRREQKRKGPAMRTLLWLNTAVLIVVCSNYRDLCHSTTFVSRSAFSSGHLYSSTASVFLGDGRHNGSCCAPCLTDSEWPEMVLNVLHRKMLVTPHITSTNIKYVTPDWL